MWDWESFRCEEEASSIKTFEIHPGEWNAKYASLSRFEDKAGGDFSDHVIARRALIVTYFLTLLGSRTFFFYELWRLRTLRGLHVTEGVIALTVTRSVSRCRKKLHFGC